MKKKEKGSLTVEAVLFLIPFLCAFLTLINMARFVQTEMLIHHAITQAAKEISVYSYVLTKSEIASEIQNTNRKSEEFYQDTDEMIGSLNEFAGALGGVGSSGDLTSEINYVINTGVTAEESLTNYFSDPEKLLSGVLSAAQNSAEQAVLTAVAGGISRGNIQTSLKKVTDDPNGYLETVGVVDGLSGLDFSKTKWISNGEGKADIEIVVTYTMKNTLFPDLDFGQHEFCQSASTLIW